MKTYKPDGKPVTLQDRVDRWVMCADERGIKLHRILLHPDDRDPVDSHGLRVEYLHVER